MDVKLVIAKGKNKGHVVRLRNEETIIGRQRGCDLRIPSSEVSRRHCRLSFRDGCMQMEDLASANGTKLNGSLIVGHEVVRPGDEIQIGPVAFRVEYALTAEAMQQMLPDMPPLEAVADEVPAADERSPKEEPDDLQIVGEEPAADQDEPEQTIDFDELGWRPPTEAEARDILSRLEGDKHD